jgi:hypothetical protein
MIDDKSGERGIKRGILGEYIDRHRFYSNRSWLL